MTSLTSHGKMPDGKWVMQFKFDSTPKGIKYFNEVRDWFDDNFPDKEEAWMGWRTDQSSLTAFIKSERAYAFSLLRWS